jgi:hypothetical protein
MKISSPDIRLVLQASGWTEARSIAIDPWVGELEAAGYEMNQWALDVLSSLGGLTIEPVGSDAQVYQPTSIHFDPLRLRWQPRLVPWERELGTSLSPLGEGYSDSSIYIGAGSKLYANWNGIFAVLGEDFEDSLATLLFAKRRGTRLRPSNAERASDTAVRDGNSG